MNTNEKQAITDLMQTLIRIAQEEGDNFEKAMGRRPTLMEAEMMVNRLKNTALTAARMLQ